MNLRRQLKKSFYIITEATKSKDASPWILDNYYIIKQCYNQAVRDRRGLKCVDFYGYLERYCHIVDYIPKKESLISFLNRQNQSFSYNQLSSLRILLSVCAINKIAFLCENERDIRLLSNCVSILFDLSNPDYDEILSRVWRVEKNLSKSEDGFYGFDEATKDRYRSFIYEKAKRDKTSESVALDRLLSPAKNKGTTLGKIIFKPNLKYRLLWFVCVALIFGVLVFLGVRNIGYASLILVVPMFLASVSVGDWLISLKIPLFVIPRVDLEKIPSNQKVLVTIASLMTGGQGDNKIFENLERFYYLNRDENIYFCVLADFPDSKHQFHIEDKEIVLKARENIDRLNQKYGDRFCLFFRERVKNPTEDSFGGWERKRGAVCQLVSHIKNGDSDDYYGGEFIGEIKYIYTLDADTNLSLESVKETLAVALHPANKPIIKNGKVVSGYGIIQPVVNTQLKSAYSSGFARLISGSGGADIYAHAFFQRSQWLFGSGNFCGKGLVNVDLFYDLVSKRLPTGIVLSHDVIEGGIIRTLSVSDIVLTDSTPKNTVSFFRRQHRWIRGDFQNLYFIKSRLLSRFSKSRLVGTVLRHSSPIFTLFGVAVGCFLDWKSALWIFLLGYSEYIFPAVISLFHSLASGYPFGYIRFFSKALNSISLTALRLFFEISASCRRAFLSLNAFIISSTRLVTRKKTLEWTTSAQTERLSSTLGKYVLDSYTSVLIGIGIMIIGANPLSKMIGLFYFVYPFVSYLLSEGLSDFDNIKRLNQKQKAVLTQHADRMLDFYLDNVNESTNHLPCDNIQFSPVQSIAYRTSPTNIGFYLLSLLAARDINKITSSWLYNRLNQSLTVIENLEKYKGNLYNWYDIKGLSVLGEGYISFVDSGNFVTMLSVLKEGVRDYYDEEERLEEISQRCEKLIEETDLRCFYDKRRRLFKIGISKHKQDENCYDLLMSEARLTSYYAVAKGIVEKKHWQSLGRPITQKYGYIGMKSWSGTAFEYLMPQLFLPLYRQSFIYESVAFSVLVQKQENNPWGVSESGYYAFDGDMSYQYKANGIQALALRRVSGNEQVLSPYSSYLSLCVSPKAVLKNLDAFEKLGMYGKYGLYEALDKNQSVGIGVKSYMAHHIGMSVIAVLNEIKDGIFIKRFLSDKALESATELLQEKIPQNPNIYDDIQEKREDIQSVRRVTRENTHISDLSSPQTALLSRGDMTAIVSSSGHIGLKYGNLLISNTIFDLEDISFSPAVVFSCGGRDYSCVPLTKNNRDCSFEKGDGYACHIASGKDFSARVKYSFSKNSQCFIVNTKAESFKKYDITLGFEPVLDTESNFYSHISFSRLFVEAEYDKEKRILYFHRRSRHDGSHIFTIAIAPRDKDMNFSFLTSRESLKAASFSSVLDYGKIQTDQQTIPPIEPFCLVRSEGCDGGRASFLITASETKKQCLYNIQISRKDKKELVSSQPHITDEILTYLLYNRSPVRVMEFSPYSIGDLWSRRISGDYPLVVAYLKNIAEAQTKELLSSYEILKNSSINTELIFITEDCDQYHRPIERSILNIVNSRNQSQYLSRKGGIFIIRKEDDPDFASALTKNCSCYLDFSLDEPKPRLKGDFRPIVQTPFEIGVVDLPKRTVDSNNGFFIEKGFVVDKSKPLNSPYSYILTGKRFSSVVTQSSLGYTFFDNAREQRLCAFLGDTKTLFNGERVFAVKDNKRFDLCAISQMVKYEKGSATYYGSLEGSDYILTVTVCPEYPIKLIKVVYKNQPFETIFAIKAVMGNQILNQKGIEIKPYSSHKTKGFLFKNLFGMTYPDGIGFAGVVDGEADLDNFVLSKNSSEIIFYLGSAENENSACEISSLVNKRFFDASLCQADLFAESMIPPIKVKTKSPSTDALLNYFLPYQISACRFYARGSFYQSGGAYGFRDQLQDCFGIIYSDRELVRNHIIRACAHQYEDGSVMHWWHTRKYNGVNRGIKSKCSDDMLYLPWVVCDYLEKTGDYSLLTVETNYLTSAPLGDQNERYEQPEISPTKESVYHHCLRAIAYGEKIGGNGLILMGSCDWNDAFSQVGAKGKGESVFTTLLFITVTQGFIPIMEYNGDFDSVSHYKETIKSLKATLEEKAFFGDRYARAFCDDGSILGVFESEECKIDILSQAFAFLSGLDDKRTKTALKTAFSNLYDGENRIFKLFSPPFSKGKAKVGYIRGYISGVRENGGQYSHGALWGALAFLKAGMVEEGLLTLDCINPASRHNDKSLGEKYKNEPYAVSADIYSGDRAGRGGWSWYTGAASWFYKIMIEEVLGIKLASSQTLLSAKPLIPFEAEIKWENAVLKITASNQFPRSTINQRNLTFPLTLPDGESVLHLRVE